MASLSPSTVYTPTGHSNWRYKIEFSIASITGSTVNIAWEVTCDGASATSTWIRTSAATFSINGKQVGSRATEYHEGLPTSGFVMFSGTTAVTGTSFRYSFTGGYYDMSSSDCNQSGTINITGLTYTVTFDLDGGTRTGGGALTQQVVSGGDATPPTCTKSGYSFNGWSGSYTNVTSNRTITALWTANTYTITYNANGGSGAPGSQTKIYGQALTLTSATPTTPKRYTITYNVNGGTISTTSKTVNCSFINWNTASSGSGTSYASGASYTANASATLYAQWRNPTAGSLSSPSMSQGTFKGWYTALHGGTQVTSSTTITGNITVYARWDYEVTYTSNAYYYPEGESQDPVEFIIPDQTKVYDVTLQLSDIVPQYDGHSFIGWATSSSSSTVSYRPGDSYTANAPLNLYGVYGTPSYTVIFVNGFGTTLKTQTVSYGGSATPPSNPTYPNRKFVGWSGDYTNVTSDRTITAMWDATPVWICKINAQGNKYWEKML